MTPPTHLWLLHNPLTISPESTQEAAKVDGDYEHLFLFETR
jgi:hypothetical protein